MNIEFIKWMVDYADEYEIEGEKEAERIMYRGSWDCIGNFTVSPLYPLLLQRAIEGINKESTEAEDDYRYIDLQSDSIDYSAGVNHEWQIGENGSERIFYNKIKSIDLAKETALKYIYEQEKEKHEYRHCKNIP